MPTVDKKCQPDVAAKLLLLLCKVTMNAHTKKKKMQNFHARIAHVLSVLPVDYPWVAHVLSTDCPRGINKICLCNVDFKLDQYPAIRSR